jgi:hypothetical protein
MMSKIDPVRLRFFNHTLVIDRLGKAAGIGVSEVEGRSVIQWAIFLDLFQRGFCLPKFIIDMVKSRVGSMVSLDDHCVLLHFIMQVFEDVSFVAYFLHDDDLPSLRRGHDRVKGEGIVWGFLRSK